MIGVVLAAFWLSGGGALTALAIGALLLLAPWVPWRYRPGKRLGEWLYFLIAIPFVLVALSESQGEMNAFMAGNRFTQLSTVYLLCLAVQEAYRRVSSHRVLIVHGALLGVLFHAGVSYEVTAYPVLVAVYALAALAWFRQTTVRVAMPAWNQRWLPMTTLGMALLLTGGIAASLFVWLRGAERDVMDTYRKLVFGPASSLLSVVRESELGSLGPMQASTVTLARFFGPDPEHLRAQVLLTYDHNRWKPEAEASRRLDAGETGGLLPDVGRGTLYHYPGPVPSGSPVTATLVEEAQSTLLSPYGTWAVRTGVGKVKRDAQGVLRFVGGPAPLECDLAWFPGAPEDYGGDRADNPAYLQVPDFLAAPVGALARQIVGGETDPRRQAQLVMDWLDRTCTYRLDPPQVAGQDRLATFLFVSRQGYCEYFASAMALMLRSLHVPCRYVLGYMVREKNRVGGYWVIRGRDAHAWVEVYLPGRGWTTWDPTPPGEMAALYGHMPGLLADLLDQYGLWFTRFWATVRTGNWKLLLRSALGYVRDVLLRAGPPLARVGLPLLAALAWWQGRRTGWRLSLRRRGPRRETDPTLRLLQSALRRMEQRLARSGQVRQAGQTLHEFGQTVEDAQARELIDVYCSFRYGGIRPSDAVLRRLGQPARKGTAASDNQQPAREI